MNIFFIFITCWLVLNIVVELSVFLPKIADALDTYSVNKFHSTEPEWLKYVILIPILGFVGSFILMTACFELIFNKYFRRFKYEVGDTFLYQGKEAVIISLDKKRGIVTLFVYTNDNKFDYTGYELIQAPEMIDRLQKIPIAR